MKTTPSRFDALVRRADTDIPKSDALPPDTDAPTDMDDTPALSDHATEERTRPAARAVGRRRDPGYRAVTLYLPVALHEAALETARRNKRAGSLPDTASGVVEAALRAAAGEESSPE